MPSALYYPHVVIRSSSLLKTALLLWDEVHTIVPDPNELRVHSLGHQEFTSPPSLAFAEQLEQAFAHKPVRERRLLRRAADLVLRPRIPDYDEEDRAHDLIANLIAGKHWPPKSFWTGPTAGMPIYEGKLSDRTWSLLTNSGVVRPSSRSRFEVPRPIGLFIMAALAEACAGKHLRRITDRTAAYSWLAKWEAATLGADFAHAASMRPIEDHARLVATSLRGLAADRIALERLVAFREDEVKHGGADHRALRVRFARAIDACIERLQSQVRNANDRRMVLAEFEDEIVRDLRTLRRELRLENLKFLLSKEVVVTLVAAAGTFVPALASVTGTLGTLAATGAGVFAIGGAAASVRAAVEARSARRRALESHPSALLYVASRARA